MKELPGGVFVAPQILPAQIKALAEQGVMSIINNRPDMEIPHQPPADDISMAAADSELDYAFIPMARALTPDVIEDSIKAYETMKRPIFAFCASGTRSTVLWCFAHVQELGVDGVLDAAAKVGYSLEQIRGGLTQFLESRSS